MNGFINILKSPGYTSSDIVVIVRSIISKAYNKKIKTGHLGTLDPGAAGVLPIAIGNATRLFDYMQTKRKIYRATFVLNKYSETLDSYSEIFTVKNPKDITLTDVKLALTNLTGKIKQVPPIYSAISINGKRAYDLARENKNFEIESREVEIFQYSNLSLINNVLNLDIECSSGTYIRSICRDLASILKTSGYMSSLIRLQSGEFKINDAVTIDELSKNPLAYVSNIENYINLNKINIIATDQISYISNGREIDYCADDGKYLLFINEQIFGLASVKNNKLKCDVRL